MNIGNDLNLAGLNGIGWHNFGSTEIVLIVLLIIFDLILRGLALWRAARNNQSGWFIIMLIFNTAGILPILYLLFFSKKSKSA